MSGRRRDRNGAPILRAPATEVFQNLPVLQLFLQQDMDAYDVEDVHPDIRAAMRRVGIDIAEPDRYKDEDDA